jgi:high-affinity iron transporter
MQEITLISVPSFVIALRETIEAALIVGIVSAYLTKTNNKNLMKDVWLGVFLAIIGSFLGALIFNLVYGGFEGDLEKIFEGFVMIIAVIVLTTMILWNFKNSKVIKTQLENHVQDVLTDNKRYAIVSLVFISVFREGIETVLFLGSIVTTENPISVSFSAVFGIIFAIVLSIGFFKGSITINLSSFFNLTSILLILFGAGLLSHAMHEFQELFWFGAYETTNAPFWNIPIIDLTNILSDSNGLGSILRSLLGYQDKPTLVEVISYFGYICLCIIIYLRMKVTPKTPSTNVVTL